MAVITKDELSRALTFYTVSGIAVALVAAIIAAICGFKILKLRTAIGLMDSAEKRLLTDEVKSTKNDLSATTAKATALESALAETRKLADQLEVKQRFRVILPEQIPQFVDALKNVPRGKVQIVRKCQIEECVKFSEQLQALMRKAGFIVDDEIVDMIVGGPTPVGLFVGVANTDTYPIHGGQIQTALAAIGFSAEGTKYGAVPDVVSIIVGPKP